MLDVTINAPPVKFMSDGMQLKIKKSYNDANIIYV